ncbi:hypothetical protein [Streptomyces sp. ISL-94]|uniref:hypothetical protein n=1 Tax=Streptomyces sp. ISL-94 TaxID=2819190 RepID=UPI001BE9D37E|nr:hypothetical protein [Streptomyces sp. ISL-94]MBT2481319.1 hypothetical protein [Streptomyces sp. ISL-94]
MEQLTQAEAEFESAWNNERYTRAELPPVDVNRVVAEHYVAEEPLTFTKAMIWDMEVRKAGNPGAFIPYVVEEGTAAAWVPGREGGELGDEFVRQSQQRLWIEPSEYGLVLEEVSLNHERQLVTFLGRAELRDAQGKALIAGIGQPLFHVQHGVAGTDERPTNTWRIVMLTDRKDERLEKVFAATAAEVWLPGFLENYVRGVLGIALTRRQQ